jgi:hypothetical protein
MNYKPSTVIPLPHELKFILICSLSEMKKPPKAGCGKDIGYSN